MSSPPSFAAPRLQDLPLVTLLLSERCNSRCVTCDYWRHGRTDMTRESVARMLPSLAQLGTRVALISGGEPLLNPQWVEIAQLLRDSGLRLWLLTSGLSLSKHAARVAQLFDAVTVSLDGADRQTYAAIRGLDAFEHVREGIQAAAHAGVPVSVRVTVQRTNYRQLPAFIPLARATGASQVSFLAVDVANPHAFARTDDFTSDLALRPQDLGVLERLLDAMEEECAEDFRTHFIAESPRRLRRLLAYFRAVCGEGAFPPVRCNVFEYSAVISAEGRVNPCFFIPGAPGVAWQDGLGAVLDTEAMRTLRQDIRTGERSECARCVCSLWREPGERGAEQFLLRRGARG